MSLLDRVTKAVGDAVDRGKKEVDQFVRIQRINGEIGDIERKITQFKNQIQQAREQAGEKTIEMLRAGTLVSPDLQPFVEQVSGIEKQIAEEEGKIAGKRTEIEKIKAEHETEKAATAPIVQQTATPASPPPMPGEAPTAVPAPSSRFCPYCGTQLTGSGAFCTQCGAKLS